MKQSWTWMKEKGKSLGKVGIVVSMVYSVVSRLDFEETKVPLAGEV